MPLVKLTKGELLKVFGPMAILVKSGCVDIYGKELCAGEKAVIHKARNYIVEATGDAEIDVTMVNNSQIQSVEETDPYRKKREIILKIAQSTSRRVVVVGCVDCGKTSFVTMLFNVLLRSGRKPGVIDGDVGQADIGPPGYITLGTSEETVLWISELKSLSMRFIGDIKPQYYAQSITSKLKELAELAEDLHLSPLIVDTDGWVRDEPGLLHKYCIVNELKPDVVVVLGDELKGLFEKYRRLGIDVYEIETPASRKTRSREERRQLRSIRYREFLEKAPLLRLKLDGVLVDGFPLLQGKEVNVSTISNFIEGRVEYASLFPGVLYIYGNVKSYSSEELKKLGFEKVKVYMSGFERGIYCSVTDDSGNDHPCIIEKIDFEKGEVLVRTMYTSTVRFLKVSRIRLREDYTEEYIEV
ncbi:MAG: GTPase [Desulfurococcaceae archaeon]|nr:GTPase [Desulfurococcaceae archaeon]